MQVWMQILFLFSSYTYNITYPAAKCPRGRRRRRGEDPPNKFCRHYLGEEEEQRNGWRGGGGKGKGGKSNKRWKEEGKPREEGMFRNANSENNIGLLSLPPPFPVFRSPFAFSSLLPTRFIFLARYDPRAFRSLNDLRYSCHFRFIHRL